MCILIYNFQKRVKDMIDHRQRNSTAKVRNGVGTMYYLYSDEGISHRRSCSRIFYRGSFNWILKLLVPFLIIESDWRVKSPLSSLIISPKSSHQNIEVAIMFRVVGRSSVYVFQVDNPHRGRFLRYVLGAYKVFMEWVVIKDLERDRWIGNKKFQCPF